MEFLAPLHPKMVHFPIALLLTYTLLEVVGAVTKKMVFTRSAFILLILGVLAAFATAFTGHQAGEIAAQWNELSEVPLPMKMIAQHEQWAGYTFWFFLVLMILRIIVVLRAHKNKISEELFGKLKYGFAVLALVGAFFVFKTGEYGGRLVYEHGVGTELVQPDTTTSN
jgi:uncharacterized membrane protein